MSNQIAIFEKTARQAEIAFACLARLEPPDSHAFKLNDEGLAYLLHAATLFFLRRDQLAFAVVMNSPLWPTLQPRLRQLPGYAQLVALLKSQQAEATLVQAVGALSDEALGVVAFKAFRDYVLINGVPDDGLPFEAPSFNTAALLNEAITGWERLQAFSSLPLVSSPKNAAITESK